MPLIKPTSHKHERLDEPLIIISLKPVLHFAQRSYRFFCENGSEFTLTVKYNADRLSQTIEALKKFDTGIVLYTQHETHCVHKFRILHPQLHEVKTILLENNLIEREKISNLFKQWLEQDGKPLLPD